MAQLQTYERVFLVLGAIGFTLLWPVMLYNGTLIALLQAAWSSVFRNGKPLLTTYTHIWPIDFSISVLVAFFDDQINGTDDGAWWLMLDLVATLQALALCALVESSRMGQRKRILELFFLWPLLWNMFGTAIILPVYLYLHTRHTDFEKFNPTISTARPKTLMTVALLGVSIPSVLLFVAYDFASDAARHATIAFFEFSPLLLGALVALVSSTTATSTGAESSASRSQHRTSGDRIRSLYVIAGLVSGAAHIYTVVFTLLSENRSTQFGRVFGPAFSSVVSGSVENIHDGALLFLQYDWIIVNVTCATWIYLLLDSRQILSGVKGWPTKAFLAAIPTLVIGPGATVAWALYLREDNLLARYKQHRS